MRGIHATPDRRHEPTRWEQEVIVSIGRYIEAKCEQDDCPYWTTHQRTPVYDGSCDLHLLDENGNADNTRHSFTECPKVQQLLGL